jgi:hypothetical protein
VFFFYINRSRDNKKITRTLASYFSVSLYTRYEGNLPDCLMENIHGNFGLVIYFHILKYTVLNIEFGMSFCLFNFKFM